jgi:putative endopeptidase
MILRFRKPLAWAVLLAGTATACSEKVATEAPQVPGINLAYMDTTVNPGDDFFMYVNGNWVKQTEIPGDQGRWGSFNELRESNNDILKEILEEAVNSELYKAGSDERKAATFYQVGMDSARAEELGIKPLQPKLEAIQQIASLKDLQSYLAQSTRQGTGNFFGIYVWSDKKNSSQNLANLYPSGLGLPDRDYYTKEDDKSKEIRERYQAHIAKMLEMGGVENAEAKAKTILAMETELATAMLTKEERRDPNRTYNKMAVNELNKLMPSFDWKAYFAELGAEGMDSLNVMQPEHLKRVSAVVKKYSLDDVKAYLNWHMIDNAAPYLNHEFVQANFDFYSKYLRGIEQNRPRWKRVLGTADRAVGEAIGKMYVAKTFPPEAKEKAQEMVENIRTAMGNRIKGLEWMSEETKKRALEKLGTFVVKIGYPEKFRDYSELEVTSGEQASFYQNVLNSNEFEFAHEMAKLGKPVDRSEWGMTPQTVNAYYNPSFNEIVFPAGILQPPFYNYQADAAVN